jgi:hypothetical protein
MLSPFGYLKDWKNTGGKKKVRLAPIVDIVNNIIILFVFHTHSIKKGTVIITKWTQTQSLPEKSSSAIRNNIRVFVTLLINYTYSRV